jgi:integrase
MSDPIKPGARPDGSTYYWFRISAGRNASGKRVQVYRSFDRLKDAKAAHARIVNEINEQRFVARDALTIGGYLDRWESANSRDLSPASAAKIRHLLRPVRHRLGARPIQSISRVDVDGMADWMLRSGRVRVGKPGTALSPRTVRDTLAVLQRALDDAMAERLISMNPVRLVKRPRQVRPEHDLWSDEESARFQVAAANHRLAPVITLQCLGLRPEEVCGLRWRDVDLAAGTLRIRRVRTLVDAKPVEKEPKTEAGKRVLPLDAALVGVLKAFKARQAAERLAAGPAYADGGYVTCDELGSPGDPARMRRVWYRLMREADVSRITPYTASRHAAGSYLARAGVSPAVIAAWLGHTDAAFTMSAYVHARPEDLAAARDALAARNVRGE